MKWIKKYQRIFASITLALYSSHAALAQLHLEYVDSELLRQIQDGRALQTQSTEKEKVAEQLNDALQKIIKPRIMDALLSPDPKAIDTYETLFGEQYHAWKFQMFENKYDYDANLKTLWPITMRTKREPSKPLGLTPQEQKLYEDKVAEGLSFRDDYIGSVFDKITQEEWYQKTKGLLKPVLQQKVTRTMGPPTHQRARELANNEFVSKYRMNPEEAPWDLKREHQKLIHKYEIFHEEPQRRVVDKRDYRTKDELQARIKTLLIEINNLEKSVDLSMKAIPSEGRGPLSEYERLHLHQKSLARAMDILRVVSTKLGGAAPVADVMREAEESFGALRDALTLPFNGRHSLLKSFADASFARFVDGMAWYGLKQDPLYWQKRDAQAHLKLRSFSIPKKVLKPARFEIKQVMDFAKAMTLSMAKIAAYVSLLLGSAKVASPFLENIKSSDSASTNNGKGSTLNLSKYLDSPSSGDIGDDSSGSPIFKVTDKHDRPIQDGYPFVLAHNESQDRNQISVNGKLADYDIKMRLVQKIHSSPSIPTPVGYKVVGYQGAKGKIYQTSPGTFYLNNNNMNDIDNATFYFAKDPDYFNLSYGESAEALNNLDHKRLQWVSQALRDGSMAGAPLTAIANALDKRLQEGGPISVQDIADIIGDNSVYKLNKSHTEDLETLAIKNGLSVRKERSGIRLPFDDINRVRWVNIIEDKNGMPISGSGNFSQYIVDGVLHAKCDFGNALLDDILGRLGIQSSSLFRVRRVGELLSKDGYLSAPGHSEVEIHYGDKLVGRYDATPRVPGPDSFANSARVKRFTEEDIKQTEDRPAHVYISQLVDRDPYFWIREDVYDSDNQPKKPRHGFTHSPADPNNVYQQLGTSLDHLRAENIERWRAAWEDKFKRHHAAFEKIYKDSKMEINRSFPHIKMIRLSHLVSRIAQGHYDKKEFEALFGIDIKDAETLYKAANEYVSKNHSEFKIAEEKTKKDAAFKHKYESLFNPDFEALLFYEQGPMLLDYLSQALVRAKIVTKKFEISRASASLRASNKCLHMQKKLATKN